MEKLFIEDKVFDGVAGVDFVAAGCEFDGCRFLNCDCAGHDFSGAVFSDCVFENCNISSVVMKETAFHKVLFKSSKMMGQCFDDCNEFGLDFRFETCNLEYSFFTNIILKRTAFVECSLRGVDFSGSDLSEAVLGNCDLASAIFDRTNLAKADLRSAFNFQIDPERNNLNRARFSTASLYGLLGRHNLNISD